MLSSGVRPPLRLAALILLPAWPVAAASAGDPALPQSIPGYELRSLDVRKPVVLDVGGVQVRVSLPIFVYCPTRAESREAIRLLRQAYDDALRLGQTPEWTAADLQRILRAIDSSLGLLEGAPRPLP